MMKLVYPACLYQDAETGNYTAEVPDLPGCVTGAASLPEAILMAVDAASGWVLDELESGNPIPSASRLEDVRPDEGGVVTLLVLDMDSYAEKYGKKAVRKNLTIPTWLNTAAEKAGVNFSSVLQSGLMHELHYDNVDVRLRVVPEKAAAFPKPYRSKKVAKSAAKAAARVAADRDPAAVKRKRG